VPQKGVENEFSHFFDYLFKINLMIPLYTSTEFDSAKGITELPLQCAICTTAFYKPKKRIKYDLINRENGCLYCSDTCKRKARKTKQLVQCLNCGSEFEKQLKDIKKTKNNFCSHSCNATYNNKHKTTGNRRSKLELWLEKQLTSLYPNLHIDYNNKTTIGSELDIYIPSLQLAFELNGIFHYEPVYGSDKLNQIQNNDTNKFQKCIEHQISLCIIDTSSQSYFKNVTSKKYLDIIVNIINQRTSLIS